MKILEYSFLVRNYEKKNCSHSVLLGSSLAHTAENISVADISNVVCFFSIDYIGNIY